MELPTRFGQFGGVYAPESLIPILSEVEKAFIASQQDVAFQTELSRLLTDYAGRPTPLTHAQKLSQRLGREVYLKREDLLHGGAHKTNNCIGQLLLAKYMGKQRIIAETGAGQNGTATAMVGAMLGLSVTVYMGAVDIARQAPNVMRMKLFGAEVVPVESGTATLKDAVNEAMRDWISHADDTYYCLGSVVGAHPFPTMVRHFHEVIGREAKAQLCERIGGLPDAIFACVGGGSNAMGLFADFLDDDSVQIFGAEPVGKGLHTEQHAATLAKCEPAVFHGMESLFLQDPDGQIQEPYSISAGLDYPGIGPQHAHLQATGRVSYQGVTDAEALHAFEDVCRTEGILPALESSHAVALAYRIAPQLPASATLLVNVSGRGDKDLDSYFAEQEALV